jgi:hypothetical protein
MRFCIIKVLIVSDSKKNLNEVLLKVFIVSDNKKNLNEVLLRALW